MDTTLYHQIPGDSTLHIHLHRLVYKFTLTKCIFPHLFTVCVSLYLCVCLQSVYCVLSSAVEQVDANKQAREVKM